MKQYNTFTRRWEEVEFSDERFVEIVKLISGPSNTYDHLSLRLLADGEIHFWNHDNSEARWIVVKEIDEDGSIVYSWDDLSNAEVVEIFLNGNKRQKGQ